MDTEESTENAGVDPTENPGVGSNDMDTSERIGMGNNDTIPHTVHEQLQEAYQMCARESA